MERNWKTVRPRNKSKVSVTFTILLFYHSNYSSNPYTYFDLFRTKKMRRNVILATALFMVISCLFDATLRNISNLNVEFYLSFMIATSMELPADLASIWGINWLGRRWSASLALALCALTMLPCAFTTGDYHGMARVSMLEVYLTCFIRACYHSNDLLPCWTFLHHLRHECWFPVHCGGDANLPPGTGKCSG